MSHRPLAVSLLLCEQVIVDEKTKRMTPVSCFTHWKIEGTLSETQSFCAVAWLTSGHGSMSAELTIERLDTGELVYRRESKATIANPLEQYRCIMRVRTLFPVTGGFQASLILDGECIALTKFFVSQKE